MIAQLSSQKIVTKEYSNLAGFDTAVAFTVTGDVEVEFFGLVPTTALTCTGGITSLSLGTTGGVSTFLGSDLIDNVNNFQIGDVWSSAGADAPYGTWSAKKIIGGGQDVTLTRSVDDITAGDLKLYCKFTALSAGASVVAA